MYRDGGTPCMSCGAPMIGDAIHDDYDLFTCGSCGAALVGYRDLAKKHPRLAELLGTQRVVAAAEPRACPRCHDPMRVMELFEVRIDLCALHGVWFDRGEEDTLARRAAVEVPLPKADPRDPY